MLSTFVTVASEALDHSITLVAQSNTGLYIPGLKWMRDTYHFNFLIQYIPLNMMEILLLEFSLYIFLLNKYRTFTSWWGLELDVKIIIAMSFPKAPGFFLGLRLLAFAYNSLNLLCHGGHFQLTGIYFSENCWWPKIEWWIQSNYLFTFGGLKNWKYISPEKSYRKAMDWTSNDYEHIFIDEVVALLGHSMHPWDMGRYMAWQRRAKIRTYSDTAFWVHCVAWTKCLEQVNHSYDP